MQYIHYNTAQPIKQMFNIYIFIRQNTGDNMCIFYHIFGGIREG